MTITTSKKKKNGAAGRHHDNDLDGDTFLFDRTNNDDEEETGLEEGEDVSDLDVLDLSVDAINEILPYLEQCDREGRTLSDVISEFWEVISE